MPFRIAFVALSGNLKRRIDMKTHISKQAKRRAKTTAVSV
jgi:hypothetical protein